MEEKIDTRPQAYDMALCVKSTCPNRCKRYYENWKPERLFQSYVNPAFTGECNIKIPWEK